MIIDISSGFRKREEEKKTAEKEIERDIFSTYFCLVKKMSEIRVEIDPDLGII
ncbi:MAG: hypothetical protein LKJ76_02470 [Lachnospiraceae bacterium]|jgi:hypothetical protein|nr:hypothetical protein [Lachnospiraceae bacterium]